MDDLVSKQAVIDLWDKYHYSIATNAIKYDRALRNLPSIQPEPRTAYWTKDVVGTVVCSKCGGIRRDNRIGHTQWCNSCGCFMRGQNEPETF